MKKQIIVNLVLIGIFISSARVVSKTSISVSQYLSYYSNSFYNYKQLSDVNDYIGIQLGHIIEGQIIDSRFYYEGDLNFFKTYSERLYHNQEFGYNGYWGSADNKKALYFGASWQLHDGREIYDFFDYQRLKFYLNSKIYFQRNLIGKFGYTLTNRNYSNLQEFNYWEHYWFAQFNTFFQTGTSITVFFNYGLKNYIPMETASTWYYEAVYDMPSVDQLVSSVKIAQSLGSKTSLSIKYLNRLKPGFVTGAAATMNMDELFTEDELYDDRYGYYGHEYSVKLTHFLPAYVKLNIGSVYYLKNYHNRKIYNLDGELVESGDNRSDQRYLIWGDLSRSFKMNWGIKSVKVLLESGYLKNDSNDSYYRFDNFYYSLGVQFFVK